MSQRLADIIRDIWDRQDAANIPRVAVFPCNKNKIPFYRLGHEFGNGHNSSTTDTATMERMFLDFSDDTHHIGIAGGKKSGGIFALDIDVKNKDIPERLRDLDTIAQYIRVQFGDLPQTASQKTPSGGLHFFYTDGTIGTQNDFFSGKETGIYSDVKGNGGYFILYDYDIDFELTAHAPKWLKKYFEEKKKSDSEQFVPGEKITRGNRNVKITSAAGKFWTFGLPPEYMLPYLTGLNSIYCDPPLQRVEIERIAKSAVETFHRDWEQTDLTAANTIIDNVLTASDLMQEQPPVEWLVSDMIEAQTLSVICGDAGCGKTWFTLYMLACIVSGNNFLDKPVRSGGVLLIDEESGRRRLARRFQKIIKSMGCDDSIPFYCLSMGGVNMRNLAEMQQLSEFIAEKNISVVAVDALMDIISDADENSSAEILPVFKNCKTIIEQSETSFIFIHHTKKDGKGYRGSSAIKGAVDIMIDLEKPQSSDIMKISTSKTRDSEPWNISAKLFFSDIDFKIEKHDYKDTRKFLTAAEKFVLEYLLNNGESFRQTVEAEGLKIEIKNMKNVFTSLTNKNLIKRINEGGAGAKAIYMIDLEKKQEIMIMLDRENIGNVEKII